MKILHISPHYGGGVGAVVSALIRYDKVNEHILIALDKMKEKKIQTENLQVKVFDQILYHCHVTEYLITWADVVLVHTWDNHEMLETLFSKVIPSCRLVMWSHNKVDVPTKWVQYPDRFFDVSPIQGHGAYIWSTGNIERFLLTNDFK